MTTDSAGHDRRSGGSSPESTDWTIDELMIARLAACFVDGDQACNGMASFIPVSAFDLARHTHAPDLVWLAGALGLEPRPTKVPASTLEAPLWRDAVMYIEQYGDFWNYALNGRWLQKFCVGAAQLDKYGNANNSVIGGTYHEPKVRLPGTAGMGDMGSIGKQLYYWNPNHNPTGARRQGRLRVVRRLPRRRRRARRARARGRSAARDHQPGGARLPSRVRSTSGSSRSIPGVTVDDVQAATGFELLLPDGEVPTTPVPTEAQVGADPGLRSRRDAQARVPEPLMEIEIGVPGQIMPPADKAVANAQRAEEKGYDAVWWPCHLMGWHPDSVWTEDLTPLAASQPSPHVYFDPLLMMGAVGAATERIRVGSVVTDLIRRNPSMVAMQALTLDHLTRGRSILGSRQRRGDEHHAVRHAVRPPGRPARPRGST